LYEVDFEPSGFEWVDCGDFEGSVISFLRRAKDPADVTLFICNFTPVPRHNYHVGAPVNGAWREALNSDAQVYGGSGMGNGGWVEAVPLPLHGRPYSLSLTIPPLGVLVLRPGGRDSP
jgi:1,4-alpha-glucan branching enzyme